MGVTVRHHDLTEALERSGWGEKRRAGAKKGAVKRAHIRQNRFGIGTLSTKWRSCDCDRRRQMAKGSVFRWGNAFQHLEMASNI